MMNRTPMVCVLFIMLLLHVVTSACSAATAPLAKDEIIRLGERMYREGILPSGEPMEAVIRGDVEVDGRSFSCVSCHMRAGLGSFEGGVITPPTTGVKLYKPYRRPPSQLDAPDQADRYHYAKTLVERPAYSRETLANALHFGIGPGGQQFNDVMPRYLLANTDMSILISYLELLSRDFSPGASQGRLAFATVITDDVSPEDRQALLAPLQSFIDQKNQQVDVYKDFIKFGYVPTVDMKYAFRQATLDVWELKGAPETWQQQLTAYQSSKPVFALLGGISNQDWHPIHQFCEEQHLPCLYPITDYPVISDSAWYTYYFNKGYAQEGEAAARYLSTLENISAETSILQIVQNSPTARALASGFTRTWQERERPPVTTITLSGEQLRGDDILKTLNTKHPPVILLLWVDASRLSSLPALLSDLPPDVKIFVSSGYLGKQTVAIPEKIRNKIYITYPYRLTPYVGSKEGGFDFKVPLVSSAKNFGERRITSRTLTMLTQVTLRGLGLMYNDLYRDHLLDVMSMQMDVIARDYERLSFGPGQRYVSKGCYIIQLGPGAEPALIPRSEWVIP